MWSPTASINNIKHRAALLETLRAFFKSRNVLEVETPLLGSASIPDPHIHSLKTIINLAGKPRQYYLQTSPEFAMKRLLATGTGAIYQIAKAFRQDELGRFHNPEFTMLEWYRPDFRLQDLMQEVDELLQMILKTGVAKKITYQHCFRDYLQLDPLSANDDEIKNVAQQQCDVQGMENAHRDDWLNLLMSHCIEPQLKAEKEPVFIYNYPATQAALSRINETDPRTAGRFEVFVQGIELANGFYELNDAALQRERFLCELEKRRALQLEMIPIDENLLAALDAGIPDCSGVALGVDRLLMLQLGENSLDSVISFPIDRV